MTQSPGAIPVVTLNDGNTLPVIGLGVGELSESETEQSVSAALEAGYRLIDTASAYGNEAGVGRAIASSGIPREEVFVTTKLATSDQGFKASQDALKASLERLGLDYVDLYLMHWPVARLRKDTWRAMTTLKKSGKARAIGVSNFMVKHLEELLDADVVPEVNQIELHPFLYPVAVTDLCAKHGIVVEAYSPLTRGARIDDPAIAKVANKLGRTSAQVLVRWGIQHGWVSLPKSTRKARIQENANVFDFEIPGEDMRDLDQLNEDLHTSWDPTDAP
jgi:diketogulonate reductase-like aldo/keto reductase